MNNAPTPSPRPAGRVSITYVDVGGVRYIRAADAASVVRQLAEAPPDKVRLGLRNLADQLDRMK